MDSRNVMPYLAALFVRLVFAGLFIIAKLALNRGMSDFTFTVYRNAIAVVFFGPLAFVFERNRRPRMTRAILYKIFLLGLFGVLDQILYFAGMKHTTASFTTTLFTCLPIISFLLALLLRLEKVKFKSLHGRAKVIGTFVSVGGVLIMTFIKGHVIGLPWTKHEPTSAANYQQNSIWGPLMILGACLCSASFNILQEITLKSYRASLSLPASLSRPASLSLTAMISAVVGVLGFILSVVVEKGIHFTMWSIHWDIKLLAYIYGGILCSGLATYISGYILQKKGTVFLTSFNPLTTLIVAVMSIFILAEQLELAKIVGGFVIVLGLYLVLWGKTKDKHNSPSTVHPEQELSNLQQRNSSMRASSSDGS